MRNGTVLQTNNAQKMVPRSETEEGYDGSETISAVSLTIGARSKSDGSPD